MSDTSRRGSAAVESHLRHFEQLYRADDDPWRLAQAWTERHKRAAVRRALGSGKLARGLELGCGNGITTRELARRFHKLVAVEGAPTAAALARDAVADCPHVRIVVSRLPVAWPRQIFDAVIASEVLYYLPADVLKRTLAGALRVLRPGGIFVSANHVRRFSDSEASLARVTELTRQVFGQEERRLVGGAWRVDVYRAATSRPRLRTHYWAGSTEIRL